METVVLAVLVGLAGVAGGIIGNHIEGAKARRYWKRWEAQSFEFKGARYSKDTFEIVNGTVQFKKG